MFNQVIVTGNDAGETIIVSKENPKFGHIRVEQKRTILNNKGWVNTKTISALIHGSVEELESLDFVAGQCLPGKIVIKESLVPFNQKEPTLDYKIAGKTNIVCTVAGQPIYRKTFYNQSGTETDEFVSHDNVDEIRRANAGVKPNVSVEESTDVDFTL
jgi:hypothetical protein